MSSSLAQIRQRTGTHQAWLVQRIIAASRQLGYTQYMALMQEDDWGAAVAALARALLDALARYAQPPEMGLLVAPRDDLDAAYGLEMSRIHRARGVPLAAFLAQTKACRRGFQDLLFLDDSSVGCPLSGEALREGCGWLDSFFDHIEVAFCDEWARLADTEGLIGVLQATNLDLSDTLAAHRAVLESVPHPVMLFDGHHRLSLANQAARYTHAARPVPAAPRDAAIGEGAPPWLLPHLGALGRASGGSPRIVFDRTMLLNGQEHCFEVQLSPLCDVTRKHVGTVVTLMDITERVQAEAQLSESRRQLSALISNLLGMAYRCTNDERWTFEYVSEGCQALTGYTATQLVSDAVSYGDLIHPADRPRVAREIESAVSQGMTFQSEYRLCLPDGQIKWVWDLGRGISSTAGDVVALEAVILDITSRKLAEEERERLVQELGEALNGIKTLRGLLPICAACKKIRDDQGYWTQIETYLSQHSEAEFTHGICPECMQRLYPDLAP